MAERALQQMANAKNQSQYITARGAALANGWRGERTDGQYGQGWNSAPQADNRTLTAATTPVSAGSPSAAPADSPAPTPAGPTNTAPTLAEQAAEEARQKQQRTAASQAYWREQIERQRQAIQANGGKMPQPPATAPAGVMSNQQMIAKTLQRGLPQLALGMAMANPARRNQVLDQMEEQQAQQQANRHHERQRQTQKANQSFYREEQERRMAAAQGSGGGSSGSGINWNGDRRVRSRRKLSDLRAY